MSVWVTLKKNLAHDIVTKFLNDFITTCAIIYVTHDVVNLKLLKVICWCLYTIRLSVQIIEKSKKNNIKNWLMRDKQLTTSSFYLKLVFFCWKLKLQNVTYGALGCYYHGILFLCCEVASYIMTWLWYSATAIQAVKERKAGLNKGFNIYFGQFKVVHKKIL